MHSLTSSASRRAPRTALESAWRRRAARRASGGWSTFALNAHDSRTRDGSGELEPVVAIAGDVEFEPVVIAIAGDVELEPVVIAIAGGELEPVVAIAGDVSSSSSRWRRRRTRGVGVPHPSLSFRRSGCAW